MVTACPFCSSGILYDQVQQTTVDLVASIESSWEDACAGKELRTFVLHVSICHPN